MVDKLLLACKLGWTYPGSSLARPAPPPILPTVRQVFWSDNARRKSWKRLPQSSFAYTAIRLVDSYWG